MKASFAFTVSGIVNYKQWLIEKDLLGFSH